MDAVAWPENPPTGATTHSATNILKRINIHVFLSKKTKKTFWWTRG